QVAAHHETQGTEYQRQRIHDVERSAHRDILSGRRASFPLPLIRRTPPGWAAFFASGGLDRPDPSQR
ncbi:MAG: hypothetical protein MI919_01650, partial [Holophagales bacterium]|nr:hypothetical protein [Holophagales bacterium]